MAELSRELIGASASLIILSLLAKGNNYGYDIVNTVEELSDGKIQWQFASIYPVLKKMMAQGFIKSYWHMEDQRPRKYYNLTESGLVELQNKKKDWLMVDNLLSRLWEK